MGCSWVKPCPSTPAFAVSRSLTANLKPLAFTLNHSFFSIFATQIIAPSTHSNLTVYARHNKGTIDLLEEALTATALF
jgi:hypothetical protein